MAVSLQDAIVILENLEKQFLPLEKSELGLTVLEIAEDMREEGSTVVYPIVWDSDRQRAAFFASGGFGKGIPTGRTGDYPAGWEVKPITDGFELANHSMSAGSEGYPATNKAAAIGGFPFGEQWQSSIHAGRWLKIANQMAFRLVDLPKRFLISLETLWNRSIK